MPSWRSPWPRIAIRPCWPRQSDASTGSSQRSPGPGRPVASKLPCSAAPGQMQPASGCCFLRRPSSGSLGTCCAWPRRGPATSTRPAPTRLTASPSSPNTCPTRPGPRRARPPCPRPRPGQRRQLVRQALAGHAAPALDGQGGCRPQACRRRRCRGRRPGPSPRARRDGPGLGQRAGKAERRPRRAGCGPRHRHPPRPGTRGARPCPGSPDQHERAIPGTRRRRLAPQPPTRHPSSASNSPTTRHGRCGSPRQRACHGSGPSRRAWSNLYSPSFATTRAQTCAKWPPRTQAGQPS